MGLEGVKKPRCARVNGGVLGVKLLKYDSEWKRVERRGEEVLTQFPS